ncbi:MAG: hypothetical protein Q9M45_01370 [Robiginitomaculum sp.]|nr:hypothetical protein [Robiginitomaculum sp.]
MRIAVNGLVLRNGIYYFRRVVPVELREIVGKTEWKESLKLRAGQEAKAHRRSAELWRFYNDLIQKLHSEIKLKASPARLAREAAEWAARYELLDGQSGSIPDYDDEEYIGDSQRDLTIEHIIEEASRKFGVNKTTGHPLDYTPQQRARLDVLSAGSPVTPEFTVSTARDVYIQERFNGTEDKAVTQSAKQFIQMVGDLKLADISRSVVMDWKTG